MSEGNANNSNGFGQAWSLKDRVIYLFGEVDDIMAYRVKYALDQMDKDNSKPVKIIMSSPGGLEPAGIAIYDALRQSLSSIYVECYGSCMSIATLILQGADHRYISENCDFMIHGGTLTVSSEDTASIPQQVLIDMGKQIEKSNLRYCEIMAARSGQSVETIQNWCKGETFFTAQEAKEAGFADEVIKPIKQFAVPTKKKKRKT